MPSRDAALDDWGHLAPPLSFVKLMALERLEDTEISNTITSEVEKIDTFRSLAAPFPPGEGRRAFGGHVYAQSAYAASKTVEKGFVIHVSYYQASRNKTSRELWKLTICTGCDWLIYPGWSNRYSVHI